MSAFHPPLRPTPSSTYRLSAPSSFMATGNRMGAKISTMLEGSMKLPASNKITFTASRKVIMPRPLPSIQSASVCGMFSLVIMKENSTALVMM